MCLLFFLYLLSLLCILQLPFQKTAFKRCLFVWYLAQQSIKNNQLFSGVKTTGIKSSHQRCSAKKGVLKNFAKFTGKHLRRSLFFNKVAGAAWHRCFPVNFAKFLRTPLFTEQLWWLLLSDLNKIRKWPINHDPSKQNQEVIFSS